jgi:hypothetical protein
LRKRSQERRIQEPGVSMAREYASSTQAWAFCHPIKSANVRAGTRALLTPGSWLLGAVRVVAIR